MVTHNMQQAARVSDNTVFFLLGEVIEQDKTETLFSMPKTREQKTILQGGLADMRNRFDRQMEELHTELIEMGALCEHMIGESYEALMSGDMEAAAKLISEDASVDMKERDIETLCLKLLLQQQPVATDLRKVSAALKMITDMERIGIRRRISPRSSAPPAA